jgi:hypothetical protein
MPDEPEKKSGQEPNLELPSLLGFGRKKKKRKSDIAADKSAPDEVVAEEPAAPESVVESDDPLAADPVPQARAGLAPATNRPKRPPPVPPPPATRTQAEVTPEPEVQPEVAPEPEVAPAPEVVLEPEPGVAPDPEVTSDSEDTEVIETVPPQPPVAEPETEPETEQPPVVASVPRSDGPVHEGNVGWADEEPVHQPIEEPIEEPAVVGGTRRERPRRTMPVINPLLAAGLTGGVVGLVGVALTAVAGRGCEVIRGVGSCGGIGLLALLVILVLEVLLGAVLLKVWRLSDPGSTSFLGVGVAAVFVLLFLLSSLESVWMFLVIPVLTVLTFVLSWWVTETFVETSMDDLHH